MPDKSVLGEPLLLSVVMVNWNTRELMCDSLRSIYATTKLKSMEIIVVDNASRDGSAETLEREFPEVIIAQADRNLGFAKGCNLGIRKSRGKYVLLINTDTLLQHPAIDMLVEFLEQHPDVGAAGPKLVYGDGNLQTGAAGSFPCLWTAFNYFFFLASVFHHSQFFRGLFIGALSATPMEVDWVSSAVMLLRREALDQIGLVPEEYVCFMEDVICCLRLRQRNWKVYLLPNVEIIHFSGGASKIYLKPTTHHAWRSIAIFFYSQFGLFQTLFLQLIAILGFCIRIFGYGLAILLVRTPRVKMRLRRSINFLIMTLYLTWEIITKDDWQKRSEEAG